jgi:hypothetical protein
MRSQNHIRHFGQGMAGGQRLYLKDIEACTSDLAG